MTKNAASCVYYRRRCSWLEHEKLYKQRQRRGQCPWSSDNDGEKEKVMCIDDAKKMKSVVLEARSRSKLTVGARKRCQ